MKIDTCSKNISCICTYYDYIFNHSFFKKFFGGGNMGETFASALKKTRILYCFIKSVLCLNAVYLCIISVNWFGAQTLLTMHSFFTFKGTCTKNSEIPFFKNLKMSHNLTVFTPCVQNCFHYCGNSQQIQGRMIYRDELLNQSGILNEFVQQHLRTLCLWCCF